MQGGIQRARVLSAPWEGLDLATTGGAAEIKRMPHFVHGHRVTGSLLFCGAPPLSALNTNSVLLSYPRSPSTSNVFSIIESVTRSMAQ